MNSLRMLIRFLLAIEFAEGISKCVKEMRDVRPDDESFSILEFFVAVAFNKIPEAVLLVEKERSILQSWRARAALYAMVPRVEEDYSFKVDRRTKLFAKDFANASYWDKLLMLQLI